MDVDNVVNLGGADDDSQPSIIDIFPSKKETIAEIYAEMASVDLIPFGRLAKSNQIRKGLIARKYKPLKSPSGIARVVNTFTDKIKEEYRALLKKQHAQGVRCSVTNDEATKCNRRYAVVNAHLPGGVHLGLGQVRVRGSCDATDAAELVRKKLSEFGLDSNSDIVANTTDGAKVSTQKIIF